MSALGSYREIPEEARHYKDRLILAEGLGSSQSNVGIYISSANGGGVLADTVQSRTDLPGERQRHAHVFLCLRLFVELLWDSNYHVNSL